jgi:hypothetical protein
MDIFDFYRDPKKHDDLKAILNLRAQKHPAGLAQNFLEKNIWVAEVLRMVATLCTVETTNVSAQIEEEGEGH